MFVMFQFEENEKKRMKAEQQRQQQKHKKQWEELVFRNESSLRELEQLQVREVIQVTDCISWERGEQWWRCNGGEHS